MWSIEFDDAFEGDFANLHRDVQDELLAQLDAVRRLGPLSKRPRVDTLKGSRYPNMKELRFSAAGGAWRVAFAFDPRQKAIVLAAGDKSGSGSERRFYRTLISTADQRFGHHLERLKTKR